MSTELETPCTERVISPTLCLQSAKWVIVKWGVNDGDTYRSTGQWSTLPYLTVYYGTYIVRPLPIAERITDLVNMYGW